VKDIYMILVLLV